MTEYVIDKRFVADVERTDRVLEIAENFGLGLDAKEFVVFDNLKIDVNKGDVIYITGQSGGGKSVLLRELAAQMTKEGLIVEDIDKVKLENRPVIELLGKTPKQAGGILSFVGINDANLYIQKPSTLSDGQRYRLRLALLIESKADVWMADEFLAVLDRDTAKVVANNMQKIARIVGATLMVATTHTDMVKDLAPNLEITKRYREKVTVRRYADEEIRNVLGEHD